MALFKHATKALSILLLKYAPKIPITPLLGAKWASFSLVSCIAPVAGFFSSWHTCLVVYIGLTVFTWPLNFTLFSLTHHLPTFCGALYISTKSPFIRALLPLLSIALFLSHPIGIASWVYTLYWIPPFIASFFTLRSLFLRALASTLTTHAIGSTLWIYTHNTTPDYWYCLLSVVWIERLLFALLMTSAYYALVTVQQKRKQWLEIINRKREVCQNLL